MILHVCRNLSNSAHRCDNDTGDMDGDLWFECLDPEAMGRDAGRANTDDAEAEGESSLFSKPG